MTRPEIIRADSVDLQDRRAPSAKDHKHNGKPTAIGSLAPHQAETIREVAAEAAEENLRSPRVSWNHGDVGDLQQYAEELVAGVTQSLGSSRNKMQSGHQEDALAIAQNGGIAGHDEDIDDEDMDDMDDDDMEDDMMDKISSSPSIEDEDIDFEFVYALHNFVATVEGQANATKGDTMVLLDDSNSYWWLVRVVKDSSIGYLPAEHIETPTERLARLNKHRNIDLSQTMLGDQADKPRNTIKSAMKRRKKTVTFTAPTYFDYSDLEYSSEEEDLEPDFPAGQHQQQGKQDQQQRQEESDVGKEAVADMDLQDESAKVEPLKPKPQVKDARTELAKTDASGSADAAASKTTARMSSDVFEVKSGDGPKKTSDGTVRDSFFKDDTVETRKLSLTPNLLRDDNASRASTDSKELKQRPSLDKLEKDGVFSKDERKKRDKKDKDKKPSAIRNFFSRKDKKKSADDDDESIGKRSMDNAESQDREEEDDDAQSSPNSQSQRQAGKLHKPQPRPESSKRGGPGDMDQGGMDIAKFLKEDEKMGGKASKGPSMRVVPEESDLEESPESSPRKSSSDQLSEAARTPKPESATTITGVAAAIRPLRTPSRDREAKAQPVKQAVSRLELDDFDSDGDIAPEPVRLAPSSDEKSTQQQQQQQQRLTAVDSFPDSFMGSPVAPSAGAEKKPVFEPSQPQSQSPSQQQRQQQQQQQQQQKALNRMSESPVDISPINFNNPPPLMLDTSSQEEDHSSSRSTPSPELTEHDGGAIRGKKDSIATSTSTTSTTAGSLWNDTNLRAFFESGSEIRDMLVVVYDKTDVPPAGPDHPVMGTLFKEQNAKLAEITNQLDNMLGDWLARKQRLKGTV